MLDTTPILPAWLVLPIGVLTLLILAGHFLALNSDREMDPQRRRIRMTNAILMMVTVPMVSYGFGVATPDHTRAFVYVWVLSAAMLFMIILVAGVDMLHSWRLHREQLREVRRQLAAARSLDAKAVLLGVSVKRAGDGGAGDHRSDDAAGR
jgi:hypothetical protein